MNDSSLTCCVNAPVLTGSHSPLTLLQQLLQFFASAVSRFSTLWQRLTQSAVLLSPARPHRAAPHGGGGGRRRALHGADGHTLLWADRNPGWGSRRTSIPAYSTSCGHWAGSRAHCGAVGTCRWLRPPLGRGAASAGSRRRAMLRLLPSGPRDRYRR